MPAACGKPRCQAGQGGWSSHQLSVSSFKLDFLRVGRAMGALQCLPARVEDGAREEGRAVVLVTCDDQWSWPLQD